MFAEERTPKVPAPHFCVKHCKLLASTYRCVLYVCNYIILRTVVVASLTLSLSRHGLPAVQGSLSFAKYQKLDLAAEIGP